MVCTCMCMYIPVHSLSLLSTAISFYQIFRGVHFIGGGGG